MLSMRYRKIISIVFTLTLMLSAIGLAGLSSGCTVLRNPNGPTGPCGEPCEGPGPKCTPSHPCLKPDCICENPPPKIPCVIPPKRETVCQTVDEQLLWAASSIEQSLFVLAAAEKIDNPPILNTAPLITPEGGMGGFIDIDWTGPIGPFVEKIAKMTCYRVKTLGNEPAIPVVISLAVKHAIIAEVLQNASFQAGRRVNILVFPSNRVIEVRYSQ